MMCVAYSIWAVYLLCQVMGYDRKTNFVTRGVGKCLKFGKFYIKPL